MPPERFIFFFHDFYDTVGVAGLNEVGVLPLDGAEGDNPGGIHLGHEIVQHILFLGIAVVVAVRGATQFGDEPVVYG